MWQVQLRTNASGQVARVSRFAPPVGQSKERFPSLHVTIWLMQMIETIVLGEQQPFEKSSDFRGAVFARLPCWGGFSMCKLVSRTLHLVSFVSHLAGNRHHESVRLTRKMWLGHLSPYLGIFEVTNSSIQRPKMHYNMLASNVVEIVEALWSSAFASG